MPPKPNKIFLALLALKAAKETQDSTGGVEKKEPKAGVTGFMKFTLERRPTLKAEQPDLTFGGIGKALGAEWRGMSDKDKEKYK